MSCAECLDKGEQIIHAPILRGIYPSRQALAGYVPKLLGISHAPMSAAEMAGVRVDIETVKDVLRRATSGPDARFSQRGLSREAGMGEDVVRNILDGSNKNPTINTLAALAEALGEDLSIFGIAPRTFTVSEEQLRDQLEQALPHMPSVADDSERAQYLAEAVSDALGLPKTVQEADRQQTESHGKRGESSSRGAPKV